MIDRVFKLGRFLTEISLFTLASTKAPPRPSSMKTAYPVIVHPPLEVGSVHFMSIDVVVDDTFDGLASPEGLLHGV